MMRWVEDEIDAHDVTKRHLDEAVALLKDIVDRGLLPAGTEYKVRSFLDRREPQHSQSNSTKEK